jgi:hypothetical protein
MTTAILLIVIGGVCLFAAIAGDKISLPGIEVPGLKTRAQRFAAGGLGGILLILGIVGFFALKSTSSPPPNVAGSNTATIGPATTGTAHPSGSTVQTPASLSSSVRFHGTITIGQTGVELDANPPTTNGSSSTFNDIAGYLHPGNGQIAEWTGSSTPTPGQCHERAQTNAVQQLQLTSGMQLCVLTQNQRTAYAAVTSVSADGSTAQATVTVWNT